MQPTLIMEGDTNEIVISAMSSEHEFQLQPDRQELDLKGFRDLHVLSWIYGGISWTVFSGYLSYAILDSVLVKLGFYLLLGITLLLLLLQITGVLIAYIGKSAATRRINRADMSIQVDDHSFTFTQNEEPVIVIPKKDIERIETLVDKHGLMLGPGTGYNVVTRSFEQRQEDTAANITKTEENGQELYQFWLDSRAVGTSQQIDTFHQWLTDQGLDEHMVTSSRETSYDWSASDWAWLVFHTILLLGTIGYAFIN